MGRASLIVAALSLNHDAIHSTLTTQFTMHPLIVTQTLRNQSVAVESLEAIDKISEEVERHTVHLQQLLLPYLIGCHIVFLLARKIIYKFIRGSINICSASMH